MLSDVGAVLETFFDVFSTDFTVYGYTFSWWNIFAFSVVASIVSYFIFRVIFDE